MVICKWNLSMKKKIFNSWKDESFECLSLLSKIDTKREISTEIVEDELCNGKLNYAHFKGKVGLTQFFPKMPNQ